MSAIKTVAVAGASGNLGPSVINQLVADGFKVTVLTRKGSKHDFPSSVTTAEVDYDSVENLTKALKGIDAVVSVIGLAGLAKQIPLVQAAVKAGVKRFLPSEYGSDAENPRATALPIFTAKKETLDLLQKEAAAGNITWSAIATGPFLDTATGNGFIVNLKNKSINLWDGGDRPFSSTAVPDIAKAVSGVLKHPEETKNRGVFVQNVAYTLNQVLEKAKKVVGSEGWTAEVKSTEEAKDFALAEIQKSDHNPIAVIIACISAAVYGEGYGSLFQKLDNELFGIKEYTDAEFEALLERYAK
ncbi:hypothetical protein M426DRAFT_268142 [Hypoxylon sp. CI-4A]|nr:hypothetical protein M426DRAFT_268142 [Hypoxylon sp. CI-4A]